MPDIKEQRDKIRKALKDPEFTKDRKIQILRAMHTFLYILGPCLVVFTMLRLSMGFVTRSDAIMLLIMLVIAIIAVWTGLAFGIMVRKKALQFMDKSSGDTE